MAVSVTGQRLLHAVWRRAGRDVAGVLLFGPGRVAGVAGDSRHVGRVEPAARPDHVEVSRGARLLRAPPVSRRTRRVQRRAALVGQVSSLSWLWGSMFCVKTLTICSRASRRPRSCCWRSVVWMVRGRLVTEAEARRAAVHSRRARRRDRREPARNSGDVDGRAVARDCGRRDTLRMADLNRALCRRDRVRRPPRPPDVTYPSARSGGGARLSSTSRPRSRLPSSPAVRSSSSRVHVILDPAPYAWLLSVPGFDRLARTDAFVDARARSACRLPQAWRSAGWSAEDGPWPARSGSSWWLAACCSTDG